MSEGVIILNPYGEPIRISQRTFDILNIKGYLKKDRATGKKAIGVRQALYFLTAEAGTDLYRELGTDFSGPLYIGGPRRHAL
jgi:hypothetical protein